MLFLQRIKKKLAKHGEQFTVGGNTYRGVFQVLSSGTMSTYLDDVERMGVVRPGLLLVAQGDAVINVNDTIVRDGRTYTVLKTSSHRMSDTTVLKIAILA
jgi:hypothetical protein